MEQDSWVPLSQRSVVELKQYHRDRQRRLRQQKSRAAAAASRVHLPGTSIPVGMGASMVPAFPWQTPSPLWFQGYQPWAIPTVGVTTTPPVSQQASACVQTTTSTTKDERVQLEVAADQLHGVPVARLEDCSPPTLASAPVPVADPAVSAVSSAAAVESECGQQDIPIELTDLREIGMHRSVHLYPAKVVKLGKKAMGALLAQCLTEGFGHILDLTHGDDYARSTHPLPPQWNDMRHPCLQPLRRLLHHPDSDIVSRGSVLRSVAGGCVQTWHLDFDPEKVAVEVSNNRRMPYTVLACLTPKGQLYVRGPCGEVVLVHMNIGDVVVFDANVWHAGGAYDNLHFRAHWFARSLRAGKGLMPAEPELYFSQSSAECHRVVGKVTHVLYIS